MAVAGNRGGAGGARNIARAQRRPLPGPPSFPRAVPSRPGALTRPVRLTAPLVARPVAPRVRRPILPAPTPSPGPRQRALAAERAYASQGRAVARAAYRQKPLAQRRAAVAAREPAALAVHRARERGR